MAATRNGQPRHRVEGADVDGAAFEGLERQRAPSSKRASRTCSTSVHGARPPTGLEAAEVGDHLEHRVAVTLGADPLVHDRAQPLDPLRPGGLAVEGVERSSQELDDAQQRLRVGHVAQPPLAAVGVLLPLAGLALRFAPGPQPQDPAAEAGDDAGLAAHLVPARGTRRHVGAEQHLEGHGREGQELHHRGALQPAAAEEEEQRARRATEAQRQRRVQAVRDPEAREEVREQRGVGLGPREKDAHVLEGDAAGGLARAGAGRSIAPRPPRRAR